MANPREALLERFRATLVQRARTARDAIDNGAPGDTGPTLRRELHTLKGEARMLGLPAVSDLVHALEERTPFLDESDATLRRSAARQISEALAAIEASLGSDAEAERIEREMRARLALLNPDRVPSEAPDPSQTEQASANDRGSNEATTPGVSGRGAAQRLRSQRFTQTETRLIDALCDRTAGLSMSFADLSSRLRTVLPAAGGQIQREQVVAVLDALDRCRLEFDDCATSAWALRLVPVEPTLQELARHTLNLAEGAGKAVNVRVHAAGVQLERDVLDQLWDALLHLVQNAVAHGIEGRDARGHKTPIGVITITAESAGPNVMLSVSDDGRGIGLDDVRRAAVERGVMTPEGARAASAKEILELLFEHGFSTRSDVTALSGRGVGLDVVRSKVESLGGTAELATEPGTGTTFVLKVPFAIAKEHVLVAEVGSSLYGLPSRIVRGVLPPQAQGPGSSSVVHYEGSPVPLRSLATVFGLDVSDTDRAALVVEIAGRRWALGVRSIVGERDLIRAPAEPFLLRLGFVAASALLDDGRLVLLPQLDALLRLLRRASPGQRVQRAESRNRQRVLVVDDSPVICDVVSEILATAGLDVVTAVDGVAALRELARAEPDLVVSDVEMPNMDGLMLLEEIRRRSARLPVVMLTTRGSAEDRRRAAALGANAYLVKSDFQSGALIDTVRRFVDIAP